MYYAVERSSYLSHHGILGQKWGVRRYQNDDGTLTAAGRERYKSDANKRFDAMLKAYKVNKYAKQLDGPCKKLSEARDELIKDEDEYFERARKNPEQFQKDVKKAMDTYIDDDELREVAQMELDDVMNEGKNLRNAWIASKAYNMHTAYDPGYLKKYSTFTTLLMDVESRSKEFATESYDAAGPKPMRNWSVGEVNTTMSDGSPYTTRDADIDMLAYLIKSKALGNI